MKRWKLRPDILLSDNIPMPLHGLAPRVILGQQWWDVVRKEAYASTNFRCQACGVSKERAKFHRHLEGHEQYLVDYEAGTSTYLTTVPLCHACHAYIHDGRMQAQLEKGHLSYHRFLAIIKHGDRVLGERGLEREPRFVRHQRLVELIASGRCAKWASWRLILFGKQYKPIHLTPEEYAKYWKCEPPTWS